MFFLAEFANMFLVCAVATTVFLGGWAVPFMPIPEVFSTTYLLLGALTFFAKTGFLIFVMMWVRWTFPRVRPDHLMNLGWKYLFPLSLLNLLICVGVAVVRIEKQWNNWAVIGLSIVALATISLGFQLLTQLTPHQNSEKLEKALQA